MTSDHRVAGSSPAGCMPQRQRLTYQEGGRCESMLGHFSRLAALADKMTDRIMSTVVRSIAAAYAETIRNIEHAAGVKIERICVSPNGSDGRRQAGPGYLRSFRGLEGLESSYLLTDELCSRCKMRIVSSTASGLLKTPYPPRTINSD